ncbi:hypothetical protein C8F04DRAFT_1238473 [Mycena alexandri]|uniref:NmrA-like domain-containing protein n=1 Tax=Mycena alexandri TaxID=1745969 RepID=A0AAD6SFL6_9AGAR|nr:hypothetical protein C8F04DRAFT_1238473 [Mycena alexandri]
MYAFLFVDVACQLLRYHVRARQVPSYGFRSKAEITNYARQSGIDLLVVEAGWYGTNHMHNNVAFIPQKEADGSYALRLPVKADTVLPVIDVVRDYGLFVREGIESPAFGAGTEVLASGEDISLGQMMSHLSQNQRRRIYGSNQGPSHIALELLHMMKFYEEFGYFNCKDMKPSRQDLAKEPRNSDFVRVNDWSSILVWRETPLRQTARTQPGQEFEHVYVPR